jgi:hypothetical protein
MMLQLVRCLMVVILYITEVYALQRVAVVIRSHLNVGNTVQSEQFLVGCSKLLH